MIQLAIIHPQAIYCQGIALLLNQYEGVEVVASVPNLRELVAHQPQVVLDIILWHIPNHHALPPGLRVVKESYPLAKVLALTEATNQVYGGLLINLGASAVISPNSSLSQMHAAILDLSKHYVPPPSSNHVRDPRTRSWDGYNLSSREHEVLQLVCEGCTDQNIADQLKISKRTVDGHRLKLRKKLHVKNTAMMVRVAVERQLISVKNNQI